MGSPWPHSASHVSLGVIKWDYPVCSSLNIPFQCSLLALLSFFTSTTIWGEYKRDNILYILCFTFSFLNILLYISKFTDFSPTDLSCRFSLKLNYVTVLPISLKLNFEVMRWPTCEIFMVLIFFCLLLSLYLLNPTMASLSSIQIKCDLGTKVLDEAGGTFYSQTALHHLRQYASKLRLHCFL